MGRLSGRKRKTGTMITILADDRRHNNFHRLIEKTTNGLFGLMKLTTNGSDANLYAVTSMTKGNNSGCLIGCGSYVSGDSGPLQSWSTSDFEIGSGPAGIIGPDDPKLSSFTLQHTIALPYSIEGVMEYDDLRLYEDDCMLLVTPVVDPLFDVLLLLAKQAIHTRNTFFRTDTACSVSTLSMIKAIIHTSNTMRIGMRRYCNMITTIGTWNAFHWGDNITKIVIISEILHVV